jgi:hypothetical protein
LTSSTNNVSAFCNVKNTKVLRKLLACCFLGFHLLARRNEGKGSEGEGQVRSCGEEKEKDLAKKKKNSGD